MLTRLARWQLSIFAIITVLAVGTIALAYLHVPAALGYGKYAVTANFAASGGLYKNANVTYRGDTIGRVTAARSPTTTAWTPTWRSTVNRPSRPT